jgi:ferrous iron transport protein A
MKLSELAFNKKATVKNITPSPFSEKLLEMGCTPGIIVKRMSSAPLGDPTIYQIGNYYLSMRDAEAKTIVIELEK